MWTSTMEKLSGMSAIYPRDTGSDCLFFHNEVTFGAQK